MPTLTDGQLLTRSEVAERLRIPARTLAQWAHRSTGPRYAIFGKHARYRLSDVISWETAKFGDDAA
jgi:excisionase family DNA binding protein